MAALDKKAFVTVVHHCQNHAELLMQRAACFAYGDPGLDVVHQGHMAHCHNHGKCLGGRQRSMVMIPTLISHADLPPCVAELLEERHVVNEQKK